MIEKIKQTPFEYKFVVAFLYTCILFLDRLDVTIVSIAMPTFANIFHVQITHVEWISNGYLIALAIVIPVSGWFGDRFGTKIIFIFAVSLFTLASILCASAASLKSLVWFRILQGIGGGMIVPVGMTMVYRAFTSTEYPKVAGYTLMPTLVAPAIAPVLGGYTLEKLSWHWLFLVNIPIGIFVIFGSIFFLKEDEYKIKLPFDWLGFIFSAFSLSLLLFTISRIGHYGFSDTLVKIAGFSSVLFLFLFLYWEKRARNPLIELKFLKIPLFLQANILQFSLQICYFGSIFLIALYLQTVVGMSPFQSGIAMFFQPIGTIMMLPISARLFHKFGPKYLVIFGMFGISVTTYFMTYIKTPDQTLFTFTLLWLRGLVIGFANGTIQASCMFDIEKSQTGRASSIFNAGRQISISIGIAISSLIIAKGFREFNINQENNAQTFLLFPIFKNAFIIMSLISISGIFTALTINNKKY